MFILVTLTCHFDDFIVVSSPEMSVSVEAGMGLLLQLMGWAYDTTDTFSNEISALGVLFNLAGTKDGVLTLDTTDKRKKEVAQVVQGLLTPVSFPRKRHSRYGDAASFRSCRSAGITTVSMHASSLPFKQDEQLFD